MIVWHQSRLDLPIPRKVCYLVSLPVDDDDDATIINGDLDCSTNSTDSATIISQSTELDESNYLTSREGGDQTDSEVTDIEDTLIPQTTTHQSNDQVDLDRSPKIPENQITRSNPSRPEQSQKLTRQMDQP